MFLVNTCVGSAHRIIQLSTNNQEMGDAAVLDVVTGLIYFE